MEQLVKQGHRGIAVIADNSVPATARERLFRFQAALGAAGIDVDPALVQSGVHN